MSLILGPGLKLGKKNMNTKFYITLVIIFIISGCGQSLDKNSYRQISEGPIIGAEGENDTYVSVSYTHLRAHET